MERWAAIWLYCSENLLELVCSSVLPKGHIFLIKIKKRRQESHPNNTCTREVLAKAYYSLLCSMVQDDGTLSCGKDVYLTT